ncbi:head-tail adaptor protein, partial [Paracoccus sp. MC1854]
QTQNARCGGRAPPVGATPSSVTCPPRRLIQVDAESHPVCRAAEAVMQARLVSKAPVIITVRRSAQSEGITSEWRAVVGGVIFDLKEDPRPSEDGGFFEVLAEG